MIFAAAMGFLWLSVAPLVSGLVGRVFGLKHFGTLYGFVFLSHQVGSFCGVLLGGVTFDWTGSYDIAWGGLIAIGLLAFMLQWPMDDRTPADRRQQRFGLGTAQPHPSTSSG
jgi:MFS family permease